MAEFADIGLVGLGVMGRSLALNMADRGFRVAVFNIDQAITRDFVAGEKAHSDRLIACETLSSLVALLQPPRAVLLMITAGAPVDEQIAALKPLLQSGDIIIDGGNSNYQDTLRRFRDLQAGHLHFLGTGVSGGEAGARYGPALMAGGSAAAYRRVQPIFAAIAAHVGDSPCCGLVGNAAAGHYVKMVHNGIEYADMQLIAETYALMQAAGLSYAGMQDCFKRWNAGELSSYLIEITADVLGVLDSETGAPLVERILDQAGQKGTGRWAAISALELGVPAPTLVEAVNARCLSALKNERIKAADILSFQSSADTAENRTPLNSFEGALLAAKACAYAQGFALLGAADKEYGWTLQLSAIAAIWRGGCIIRARFLDAILAAFERNPQLENLLFDAYFRDLLGRYQNDLRQVVAFAAQTGVAVPAMASALAYLDAYRSARLPANLIQAQRDYFGAHTYRRVDKDGVFHTDWEKAAGR